MASKPVSQLADLRNKAGFTQVQLAALIGVTPNTIQNWEKEDGFGQLEKYLKLCEILGCEIRDLIKYVDTNEDTTQKIKNFSVEQLRSLRKQWDTDVKKKVNHA